MSASDYQVTFGYGAQDGVYYGPNGSIGPFHKGNDRPCPDGTPVVIARVTIGLTGHSGAAAGPHLHTQAGSDPGCQQTFDPSPLDFQPGTVTRAGTASQWGNFVTMQVEGGYITYAHLSEINVSVGQVIEGAPVQQAADYNFAKELSQTVLLRLDPMSEEEYNQYHAGKTQLEIYSEFANSEEAGVKRNEFFFDYPKTKQELAALQDQVSRLQSKLDGISKAPTVTPLPDNPVTTVTPVPSVAPQPSPAQSNWSKFWALIKAITGEKQ